MSLPHNIGAGTPIPQTQTCERFPVLIFLATFLKAFAIHLIHLLPLILVLFGGILLLAFSIGRREKWSRIDTIYYACITATTVGYGDLHPTQRKSKIAAIFIALLGLLVTGIVVASAVNSVSKAYARKFEFRAAQAPAGEKR
jgi:voltage-gated potassium channel